MEQQVVLVIDPAVTVSTSYTIEDREDGRLQMTCHPEIAADCALFLNGENWKLKRTEVK